MKKIVLYILLFSSLIIGQNSQKYNVEFNEIEGELSKNDLIKDDFGRYDGFQLPLYQGEKLNVNLFSQDFTGKLLIINPMGEVFKEISSASNGLANIVTSIPSDGEYIIYVVGDSKSFGKYFLQYGLASSNSVSLYETDFCSTILFLTEHANANFLLLENFETQQSGLPKIPGSIDSYLEEEEPIFVSLFYEGNSYKLAEDMHSKLVSDLAACLSSKSKAINSDKKKGEIKSSVILMKQNSITKSVGIKLLENKDEEYQKGKYSVLIEIKKN